MIDYAKWGGPVIDYAKLAYDAYCNTRQWKSFNGDPLPQWDQVKPDIKQGWEAASQAVLRALYES